MADNHNNPDFKPHPAATNDPAKHPDSRKTGLPSAEEQADGVAAFNTLMARNGAQADKNARASKGPLNNSPWSDMNGLGYKDK